MLIVFLSVIAGVVVAGNCFVTSFKGDCDTTSGFCLEYPCCPSYSLGFLQLLLHRQDPSVSIFRLYVERQKSDGNSPIYEQMHFVGGG